MTDHRYLAVDRRNLFSWLSRGLVLPRALMDKYRPDALETSTTMLPLASAAAVGRLSELAEYPVCVELAPEVGVSPSVAYADPAVLWTRGALSTRRIARVHVPSPADVDEMGARAYRGFDAGDLEISVSPTLFAAHDPGTDPARAVTATEGPLDDGLLTRREAVAGAMMSMFSGPVQTVGAQGEWPVESDSDDPIRSLVRAAESGGLVARKDDLDLLHGTLRAIYDQSGQGDIVASVLLARIAETVVGSQIVGIDRHLERILELTQGEDQLKPFRGHGGLLTTKALLLYLLRPDPKAVRGWEDEDLNTEAEVLQLSRLLAGFASRYGGLPSSLRVAAGAEALLDWMARGLQPSDFALSVDTAPEPPTPAPRPSAATDANPAVDALARDLLASNDSQALTVAQALGWNDCLQLRVTADSFATGTANGQIHVTFTPGAALTWSLDSQRFTERLKDLSDADLHTALKPKRAQARRPTKTTRGNTTRATGKKSQNPADEDPEHASGDDGSVGPPSYR